MEKNGNGLNVINNHCQMVFGGSTGGGVGSTHHFYQCSVSAKLSKAVLGPIFDLCTSWCRPSVRVGLGRRRLRRCQWKAFPPVFASVGDGEAQLASVMQAHPG